MVGSWLGSLTKLWIYSLQCASEKMALIFWQVRVVLSTLSIVWRLEWHSGWSSRVVSVFKF